ncbi:conserved hypothetical protein [Dinoroseobacter shibae DFL 12 = DSM 16493]|uniref:DUF3108 domain-containing protein n=1 Tax=Dinoroseobacter shibae (strain DSM 16493 / NCIMB 14021 / DFL 12) TaxID=398580 RepID=A8LNQ8_DINSH|nr:hypothetical protein [Dinoroseobacter shibae]ABV92216.1 conserved hypothetical protein [Dinoroseobacter shibae DFL 12 = DSM 16493]URF47168.1 hypothetical protein M8008_02390 [Dinoroseobacter shibae]URF51479.1 hypothetical protein M8007_02390 [Dinoroseobacter shibae]
MRTILMSLTIGAWLCAAPALAAPLEGEKTYDLLFRQGTLDTISRSSELVYRRTVKNSLKPEAAERDTGDIALSFRQGEAVMALLEFRQGGKYRTLGTFPASVGNPMIMYFYETVVRDMAETAGGSPFYIRNRVKEALVEPSEIIAGEAIIDGKTVETSTIRMLPFEGDPNVDRMRGFGDLELQVTMSEAVPGWYMSMEAKASNGEVYSNTLDFERLDVAR